MNIKLYCVAFGHYTAKTDTGIEGYGRSPDEALGHCVRECHLVDDTIVIDDISTEEE